jgi:hypothetical protein
MKFSNAMCDQHAWGSDDDVEFKYYDHVENKFVQVASDSDLFAMFAKNVESKLATVRIDVVI